VQSYINTANRRAAKSVAGKPSKGASVSSTHPLSPDVVHGMKTTASRAFGSSRKAVLQWTGATKSEIIAQNPGIEGRQAAAAVENIETAAEAKASPYIEFYATALLTTNVAKYGPKAVILHVQSVAFTINRNKPSLLTRGQRCQVAYVDQRS